MAETSTKEFTPLPEAKLSRQGGAMLPLGLRLERVSDETNGHRNNAVIDEHDPALEADLFTFFQIVLSGSAPGRIDSQASEAKAGSLAPNTGALIQSLQAYGAVAEHLLGEIYKDEASELLPHDLLRTAFESYPFFYNGEQFAQGSGFNAWDRTLATTPDTDQGEQ
jgi:hypothetical protein